jgi:8-oxo-dGTP pyrophosphatase MutT (NUDIX family)
MKFFVNDKPLKIVSSEKKFDKNKYTTILTGKDDVMSPMLVGDLFIANATTVQVSTILRLMEVKKLKKLDSITLAVQDTKEIETFIKDQFKIIRAAGGLVKKGDLYLMIHRLGTWDLPKGKLEKEESPAEGALREVEEECGVKVEIDKKIGSTWHTYIRMGKRILKKTDWYVMNCLDDTKMSPQEEEDIDEVCWKTYDETQVALEDSYGSIKDVFRKYKKKFKDKV